MIAGDPYADLTDVYAFVSPDKPDSYQTGPFAKPGDANLNVQQTATVTKSVRGAGDTVIGTNLPVQPVNIGPHSNAPQINGQDSGTSASGVSGQFGVQIERLGNPLVNEVVVPLAAKDHFNATAPAEDAQFLPTVINPELPGLINALYGVLVPPAPRNDLVTIFLTGIPGLNQPADVQASEMLRLNMGIAPTAGVGKGNRMGVLGGDNAGFPNGRRPEDDVVDIAIHAMAGATPLTPDFNEAPNNVLGDGVNQSAQPFNATFPYLSQPNQGFSHTGGIATSPTGQP